MPKRSLLQIQESLRKKLAEADPLNPLGDIGRTSPHRGDPIMSPDLGGGQGPGGAGRGNFKPDPRGPSAARSRDRAEVEKIRAQQQQLQQQNQPTKVTPQPQPAKVEPQPAKVEPQPAPAEKPLSRQDQKNLDKYGTTDQEKIANIKKLDAEREKVEKETPILGPYGRAAVKTGTVGALGYGAYELFKPDQEKPADQPPVATNQTPPVAPKPDARTQSALPQGNDQAAQDVKSPATDTPEPPPNKPYPPGTKFSDEILETYYKVLNRYRDFLNEETEQQRREAERLRAIQSGIYGQESRSGKARTDRPNYAGALGPMQIMPKTFQWMKDTKIIPKDFDIKNPEQNREAGNALIAHYYKKYEGDPAKVAAAYYAGPGAIRKDGTINTHWRDRKNPKAPDVGQYINQTLSRAGLSDVTYTAAQPNAKPDTKLATAPAPITPVVEPTPTPADITPTAKARVPFDSAKFDYDAFYRAVDTGQDWSDLSKFTKTASAGNKPSVSERYERYKQTQDNH